MSQVLDFENMSFDELDRLEAASPVLMGSRTAGVAYSKRPKKAVITRANIYSDQFERSFEIVPLRPIHRPGFMAHLKKGEKPKMKKADPDNLIIRVGNKDWRVVDIDKNLLATKGLEAKDLTFRFK